MCGLVGSWRACYGGLDEEVERLAIINNRGHEAVGIVASDGYSITPFRRSGYVRDACTDKVNQWRQFANDVVRARCDRFVGHVRYSTVGATDVGLAQPIRMTNPRFGEFYLAHNGQYPYHLALRSKLEANGHRFHTDSDSEVLAAYLASLDVEKLSEAIAELVRNVEGSFTIIALSHEELVAARDRFGIRPLWFNNNGSVYFASETGALPDSANAKEVMPGSMVVCTKRDGEIIVKSHQIYRQEEHGSLAVCMFEQLYFARPDQRVGATDTSEVRRMLGRRSAKSHPVEADIVCSVPDSGTPSAVGFAEQCNIRYEPCAINRNYHSVRGRSFILPGVEPRTVATRRKYTVSSPVVCGERVVVVDDTIVRLTTMPVIVEMLFYAGASEVHVRIPAPKIVDICYLGIDMKSQDELPAARMSVDDLNRDLVRATSLAYLTLPETVDVCSAFHEGWCTGCFGGKYPIARPKTDSLQV